MKRALSMVAIASILALCGFLLLYNLNAPPEEPIPTSTPPASSAPTGKVVFVNDDPARQAAWEDLAKRYTEQTGVSVQIIPKPLLGDTVPTMFTVSSQEELEECKDLCVELGGINATNHLRDWSLALYDGRKMCALPAEIEGFGLIYNAALLRQAGKTPAGIDSFAKLTETVEITDSTAALKFAPFACINAHGQELDLLAALGDNIRPFWDLYAANTACDDVVYIGAGKHDEITKGSAAFCIGSTTDYGKIAASSDGALDIMPLYLGGENEGSQGLCVKVRSYWCVRNDVDALDIEATLAFLDYLFHPQESGVPVDSLEICTPYVGATYATSPLERTLREHISSGKDLMVLQETTAPAGFADALMAYTADPTDENWAAVTQLLK